MSKNAKTMVGIGLFTAIVIVLQTLVGSIKVGGMFSLTLVLVPVVVGSAVYGWKAGAWLGFVFGVAVLLSGDAGSFLAVDPLATAAVVLLKGTLSGLAAGLVYRLLAKVNQYLGVIAAAVTCPVVNTGVFLIGCRLFFYETVQGWGAAAGFPNAAAYMFLGLAGINFLVELGRKCSLVATGGIAPKIVPYCSHEIVYDENLLLRGLGIIYRKNKKQPLK